MNDLGRDTYEKSRQEWWRPLTNLLDRFLDFSESYDQGPLQHENCRELQQAIEFITQFPQTERNEYYKPIFLHHASVILRSTHPDALKIDRRRLEWQ